MKVYDAIVTGGLGFIGKHLVDLLVKEGKTVCIIDKKTYAADMKAYERFKSAGIDIIEEGIESIKVLPKCKVIYNTAAESHVDNSIAASNHTMITNFMGVHNLLELIRNIDEYDRPLFEQMSTDEIFGDTEDHKFTETSNYNPSNPYASSKGAAELLIRSYGRTYGLEYLITRSCNNYGKDQFPEKLIPRAISCKKRGDKFPVHGNGTYVRQWIHADDHCRAIFMLVEDYLTTKDKYQKDKIFNVSGETYLTNNEVLDLIDSCDKSKPLKRNFVENRWGQDVRYAIDSSKIKKFVDWKETYSIHKEIKGIYDAT